MRWRYWRTYCPDMSFSAGVRLGVGTLTIFPVGSIHPLPPSAARVAMAGAPLAALPVGVAAGLTFWISALVGLPAMVVGALTLAAIAIVTRAMHLDGFADTIDGFGGGWTRERALEIMHRGDVGPMGVAALVLLLIAQAGLLAQLTLLPWTAILVGVLVCAARLAATLMCSTSVPPARESGMGAVVARSVPVVLAALVSLATAAVLTGAVVISGLAWWWGPVAVIVLIAAVVAFGLRAVRRFGGVTGDVLGAAIEVAFTALLLALAIAV